MRRRFRQAPGIAFVIDLILLCAASSGLFRALALIGLAPAASVTLPVVVDIVFRVLFSFKDGINGPSPGKWIWGLQTADDRTHRPIGLLASFHRNLSILAIQMLALVDDVLKQWVGVVPPLIFLWTGLLPLLAYLSLSRQIQLGYRWGDRASHTKVVWKNYAHRLPFDQRGIFCETCGYNLNAKVSGTCPECGMPILRGR